MLGRSEQEEQKLSKCHCKEIPQYQQKTDQYHMYEPHHLEMSSKSDHSNQYLQEHQTHYCDTPRRGSSKPSIRQRPRKAEHVLNRILPDAKVGKNGE